MSASALGPQFRMMRPSELLPHADDRSQWQDHVDKLGESISRRGYRTSLNNVRTGAGDWGTHIRLARDSTGKPFLPNGNHRVHAMVQAGYDKPVPVHVHGSY